MASTSDNLVHFQEATRLVYGPVEHLSEKDAAVWKPPDKPGAGGHRGRYLWTDAFGVLNFITLSKETSSPVCLRLAERLVDAVHNVLGRTRDGAARLPGATDAEPLKGGLRIGKTEAHGSDGDGQYHHYLTLWMFALNRLALAGGNKEYNQLAVQLAKAVHPRFLLHKADGGLRMVWKVSTDGETVLVPSEGHLDAVTGFVVYRLLQCTAALHGEAGVLTEEIADYRLLVSRKGKLRTSSDPLDLGMGMWVCHFFRDEDWARVLGAQSLEVARVILDDKHGMMARESARRLAFREFGACLGLECFGINEELEARVAAVVEFWQAYLYESAEEDLRPISLVMYASALIPGGELYELLRTDGHGC
jgi:hypothetical protein